MPFGPENTPRQELQKEAEPRTGAVILATREYVGTLLNTSLKDKKLKLSKQIDLRQQDRAQFQEIKYRYWLELGKEEALKYALNHNTIMEKELRLEKHITADDRKDIPIKTPQEIINAKIITSKCVDIAYAKLYHKVSTDRNWVHAERGIQSLEEFTRVAGFYQGLSYLLEKENDGGMAEFIKKSNVKDFKLPAHP